MSGRDFWDSPLCISKLSDLYLGFYHDYSAARDYNTGRMGDLSLTIACNASVLSDVLVPNGRDPQLGAVVEDAHRGRGSTGLASLYQSISGVGVPSAWQLSIIESPARKCDARTK